MANIHEIARRAGVSVSTVSRVLNQHPYVSAEKRAAVQRAIDELDYTPNRNAVDLIRGRTRSIGVIIPYNNNPAFDRMLSGVLNKSVEEDYTVTVLPTRYDPEKELEYLTMLKTKLLDGIIITSRANDWSSIVPFAGYGHIVACEYTELEEIGCAYIDRYAATLEVFSFLKNMGHTEVAFTTARGETSISTRLTMQAYRDVFGEVSPCRCLDGCTTLKDGMDAARHFLEGKVRPTAVYANGDEVAAGIHQFVLSAGLRIPEDVAIIGQENQPIGQVLQLTTVDHQLFRVGEEALRLVTRGSGEKVQIPYRIIYRSSSG
ncbi:LacI family DNA-binding transcriptional regulator [Paenibacillus sp. AR247]|uniref:LacI family DNA-binding transcriptional regulator n=1 Tax=Paenibacillus sp. AR247 TaxID=1631599 RepID=UPI000CF9191F|nr:LacI family DNA-binding transcriptional regulator [Paenibacillus sp. AR247]PQP89171.1 LacI family transcriptional regulator [Paenibacillus sp. AR247]